MKQLFIISAGDFGREVLEWALAMPACGREWEVAGFLDTRPDILKGHALPVDVAGSPETWEVKPDHVFICALGHPLARLKFAGMIRDRGGRFVTVIHPTAIIGRGSTIGQGCILCPFSIVSVNVTIGDFVVMNYHATVGHDAIIGDGCTLSPHADVTGHVKLGQAVFLGSHASVLPSARVGDRAVVGAGSAVLRHVEADTTVSGVMAKVIYRREP